MNELSINIKYTLDGDYIEVSYHFYPRPEFGIRVSDQRNDSGQPHVQYNNQLQLTEAEVDILHMLIVRELETLGRSIYDHALIDGLDARRLLQQLHSKINVFTAVTTYYSKDLDCTYYLNDGVLEYAHGQATDLDEFSPVDEELVGEEFVNFEGARVHLLTAYRRIESILGGK